MEKIDLKTASVKLKERKTLIGSLTYLVFFLPRFTEYKNDPEMHYHMKQSLGLLIVALDLQGIISILGFWGMPHWRVWPVRAVLLYLLYIGVLNVINKKLLPLPWFGKYSERVF